MTIRYFYHFLGWREFESLVTDICRDILGTGTVVFSDGKDGGRDGRFSGTAENHPSKKNGWSGEIIIQCKHTIYYHHKVSDKSFDKVITDEIPKLEKLVKDKELDYYLLFTNRRGAANAVSQHRKDLAGKICIPIENIDIICVETLDSWLFDHPKLVEKYNLLIQPLRFYDQDIKDVLSTIGGNLDVISTKIEFKDGKSKDIAHYIDKSDKNETNNLSKEYFQYIVQNSLEYFTFIQKFLSDPRNSELLTTYQNISSVLNSKVMQDRKKYEYFEDIINEIIDELVKFDKFSRENKKLLVVFLHFMYWNCELGLS